MRRAFPILAGFGIALGAIAAARALEVQLPAASVIAAARVLDVAPPGASAIAAARVLEVPLPAASAIVAPASSEALAPPAAPPLPSFAPIGPAYDSDDALATHADEVADYTLHARLDPDAHAIHGEGTITWRNASRVPQRELWVHLYLNGFKNEGTLLQRTSSVRLRGPGWGYIDVKRFAVQEMDGADLWPLRDASSPGEPADETDIRVPLSRDVAPGETIHIDVAWDSQLPALMTRTGYAGAFHMVGQWFPKLARLEPDGTWAHFPFHFLAEFYADFGRYDVAIDTPAAVVVGATGTLVEEITTGTRIERRYVQENIHDFAFAAWDGFKTDAAYTEDGVLIRCLYPPGYEDAAAAEIAATRFGLDYLGKIYGRYPYRKLVLVHPPPNAPQAGGMEYPMLITTGGAWYGPYGGAKLAQLVSVHELAHQWFYGLVATNEHDFPFLDEGLTSYAEADALEARYPGASFFDLAGARIGDPALHRYGSTAFAHDNAVAEPATAFTTRADYGAIVYYRASTILSTFERVYGEELVHRALGRYARRYRFQHPRPEDLLGAFREVLGDGPAETLRVALFERGWVDFTVERVSVAKDTAPEGIFGDPDEPGAAPESWATGLFRAEIVVRRRGTLALPVDIDLLLEDGTSERLRWDAEGSLTHLRYAGKSRVVSAVIDPEHRVLLDPDLVNNAWSAHARLLAPRVLERAAFAAGVGLGLGAP